MHVDCNHIFVPGCFYLCGMNFLMAKCSVLKIKNKKVGPREKVCWVFIILFYIHDIGNIVWYLAGKWKISRQLMTKITKVIPLFSPPNLIRLTLLNVGKIRSWMLQCCAQQWHKARMSIRVTLLLNFLTLVIEMNTLKKTSADNAVIVHQIPLSRSSLSAGKTFNTQIDDITRNGSSNSRRFMSESILGLIC